ncbi:hypothetical protein KEJ32_04975, partial [Candidatus Bathyarchaeota archaeon]|nr:hypothetical protein [Candidatus Bathyarchaeota archaeon]
ALTLHIKIEKKIIVTNNIKSIRRLFMSSHHRTIDMFFFMAQVYYYIKIFSLSPFDEPVTSSSDHPTDYGAYWCKATVCVVA